MVYIYRPVVSGCGTPTEKLSEFVDHYLQPMMSNIPSYIQDTADFIRRIRGYTGDTRDTILVTIDVVALYPSIPISDGIDVVKRFLDTFPTDCPLDRDTLCNAISLVLENNICKFGNDIFLQKSGTAIGTKLAPVFANIFMWHIENTIQERSACNPELWTHFIDDIFMLWQDGEEALLEFLAMINNIHPSIMFTSDWSRYRVNFLDVTVSIENGQLVTDVYSKPTDTHQYLLSSSCHPRHCKNSLPYSQALRMKRICSDSGTMETRFLELTEYFVGRGYNRMSVTAQINKARLIDRNEALLPKVKNATKKTPLVVTYNPTLANIGHILYRHFSLISGSVRLSKEIPPPVVALDHVTLQML